MPTENTIQTLLDTHEYPTVLADFSDCKIMFLNEERWEEFGYQSELLLGTRLYDHFKNQDIVLRKVLWPVIPISNLF